MAIFRDLPEVLLDEIMSRLPPESLKRFRLVCKSWCVHINALINDPVFVAKHLSNMKNNLLSAPRLHLRNLFTFRRSKFKYMLTVANCDYGLNNYIPCLSEDVKFLIHNQRDKCCQLVSHCNGIICVSLYNGNVILLNPALRELKVVLKSSVDEGYSVRGVGFGYDSRASDYKVVTIKKNFDFSEGGFYKAEVYSLSTNSSKEIKVDAEIINFLTDAYQPVYCNGVCYWYCLHNRACTIVSFDVSEEIFRRVPFPGNQLIAYMNRDQLERRLKIAVWNESIALFYYLELNPLLIEMWVMDACSGGVEGSYSWTRHLTIGPLVGIYQPAAFWGNKELFMETKDGKLISYNLHTQELNNLSISKEYLRGHVVIDANSLVSVVKKKKRIGEAQLGRD